VHVDLQIIASWSVVKDEFKFPFDLHLKPLVRVIWLVVFTWPG